VINLSPYPTIHRTISIAFACNALLCTVKLAAGLWGNSFALVADGINSFADAAVSIALLFGMRFAALFQTELIQHVLVDHVLRRLARQHIDNGLSRPNRHALASGYGLRTGVRLR